MNYLSELIQDNILINKTQHNHSDSDNHRQLYNWQAEEEMNNQDFKKIKI